MDSTRSFYLDLRNIVKLETISFRFINSISTARGLPGANDLYLEDRGIWQKTFWEKAGGD